MDKQWEDFEKWHFENMCRRFVFSAEKEELFEIWQAAQSAMQSEIDALKAEINGNHKVMEFQRDCADKLNTATVQLQLDHAKLIQSLKARISELESQFAGNVTIVKTKFIEPLKWQDMETVWKDISPVNLLAERDELLARNAELMDALKNWASLIDYQFTGSKEAMSALQNADNLGQKALSTNQSSSDEWKREIEANALEEAIAKVAQRKMPRIGLPEYNTGLDDALEELRRMAADKRAG